MSEKPERDDLPVDDNDGSVHLIAAALGLKAPVWAKAEVDMIGWRGNASQNGKQFMVDGDTRQCPTCDKGMFWDGSKWYCERCNGE